MIIMSSVSRRRLLGKGTLVSLSLSNESSSALFGASQSCATAQKIGTSARRDARTNFGKLPSSDWRYLSGHFR